MTVDLRALAEQAVDSMLASAGPVPCPCEQEGAVGLAAGMDEDLPIYDDETDTIWAAGNMPGQLVSYWVHGEGAAKIGWGSDGSFNRCVSALDAKGVNDPKGTCANLYKTATGKWPGPHKAAMEDTWMPKL